MRVLIAAGGTGGHIYPGIAVAKEIMRRDPSSTVRFVGTAHGLETRLVPKAGFEVRLIESAGLKNVSLIAKLRGLLLLPKSFFAARRVIREFDPDIVVGAGGYVSGPVLLVASLMKLLYPAGRIECWRDLSTKRPFHLAKRCRTFAAKPF
jgi:UDP-N-acetylglucosamine--N-acetylmuramyl-(pentapeptide) pyrophosphoryl-undecaprenol N-acetylglucosamine transferase